MKVKKEDFLKVIPGSGGLYTSIAQRLHIDRHTVARYIARFPDLRKAVEEETETTIEMVEHVTVQRCLAGDVQACMFYLKTKGKHHGYTEKSETELSGTVTMAPPPVICFGSSGESSSSSADDECKEE